MFFFGKFEAFQTENPMKLKIGMFLRKVKNSVTLSRTVACFFICLERRSVMSRTHFHSVRSLSRFVMPYFCVVLLKIDSVVRTFYFVAVSIWIDLFFNCFHKRGSPRMNILNVISKSIQEDRSIFFVHSPRRKKCVTHSDTHTLHTDMSLWLTFATDFELWAGDIHGVALAHLFRFIIIQK